MLSMCTIDAGGQLFVDAIGVSRTVIVAHTYVVAGVKQGYGTYYSSSMAMAMLTMPSIHTILARRSADSDMA